MGLSHSLLILAAAFGGFSPDSEGRHVVNTTPSYCAGAETVRAEISGGFTPDPQQRQFAGPGWRVQQQYPNTALFVVLKYMVEDGTPYVVCQYSSQIGVVYARVYLYANIDPSQFCLGERCDAGVYWRREWVESDPGDDRPGRETLWVCTREDSAGVAWPSRGCRFYLPPAGAPVPDVHGASGSTTEPPGDEGVPW